MSRETETESHARLPGGENPFPDLRGGVGGVASRGVPLSRSSVVFCPFYVVTPDCGRSESERICASSDRRDGREHAAEEDVLADIGATADISISDHLANALLAGVCTV